LDVNNDNVRTNISGLWVGQIIALPAKIRRWLIQLYLAYTSDNKLIIYRFKRGFFVGYV